MELTATIGKIFDDYDELSHWYTVTDGKTSIEVMEWDDVAAGESPDSHIISNMTDDETPESWSRSAILDAVQEAYADFSTEESFLLSAESRETSISIMTAIWSIAHPKTYEEATRIWEDPTNEEFLAIWEIVTGNDLRPSTDYCWGDCGSNWALTRPLGYGKIQMRQTPSRRGSGR
jgi:hypothetical protein